MFNWYNKQAPKNTIVRYLSWKYTQQELTELTHLTLPDNFESLDYANELNLILTDSPWKVSEVQYQTSSLKSLKGVFSKDYWFGKKQKEADLSQHETTNPYATLTDNPSEKESIYYEADDKSETNSIISTNSETSESVESIKDLTVEEPNFSWKTPHIYTYEFLTDQAGIIFLWKAWTGTWQAPFVKGIYFDKARKYGNSWVKVQVCEKLPLLKLPAGVNCFFEPVKTKEEMIKKNYWTNCWIEDSKELSNCSQCSNYFLPEGVKQCANCVYLNKLKEEMKELNDDLDQSNQPNNFWEEDNKDLLIIAGLIVVAVIIYQSKE